MAKFNEPRIQPYNPFREIGVGNLQSKYLPNEYRVEFTPAWWRKAIDNAINYSDLTFLDMLYSWCIQSSPFLVSQINKRLMPIAKTEFAFANPDGTINEEITKLFTSTKWFKKLIRSRTLSKFYGVKVVGIDVDKDLLFDYPLRNIDIINQAVRYQTYGVQEVAKIDSFDNLFFMMPETDQDFKLGYMQPISRSMIGIVESYINWSVAGATYSYPRTTVGYIDGNAECKSIAEEIANNLDPLDTPILPFKQTLDDKANVYQVEIKPVQTQMYADAFRIYKELIEMYRGEIMQLVTGGTLLGATEKNTNSEQLAQIHMSLYEDICDDDKRDILDFFNKEGVLLKLSALYGRPEIAMMNVVEVPDRNITIDKFERIGKIIAQQGLVFNPSVLNKVGLEESDINTAIRNNNWGEVEIQKKTGLAKIKEILFKSKDNGNGGAANGRPADGQASDTQ